jgi:misacylated tRNA(Ala) deacylase
MPMKALFRDDAYLSTAEGSPCSRSTIAAASLLDQTCFYATSGGQPGDTGFSNAKTAKIEIAGTVTGETKDEIIHVPGSRISRCRKIGENLVLHIDWDRRYKLMRMHTACHLLTGRLPLPDHRRVGRRRPKAASISTFPTPTATRPKSRQRKADGAGQRQSPGLSIETIRKRIWRPILAWSSRRTSARHRSAARSAWSASAKDASRQPALRRHPCHETPRSATSISARSRRRASENRRFRIRFGPLPAETIAYNLKDRIDDALSGAA